MPTLLYRASWEASALLAAYPPVFHHPNKRLVQSIAMPEGAVASGEIRVTRWGSGALPITLTGDVRVGAREGFYTYEPDAGGTIGWHQNFADPNVFGYYAGGLYAQDEMQVSEHPALASVRSALVAVGQAATENEAGPTPVLVHGVERRVVVDTEPSLEPGRLQGLYGNRFAAAAPEVIRSATHRINPPTRSNIVAIAAPPPHRGLYTGAQIERILRTATAGYEAAVAESAAVDPSAAVVIHTGFWGCGAFGGNRTLMIALQIVAARLAGVTEVVFHVGARSGLHDVSDAGTLLGGLPASGSVAALVDALVARRLSWGASDGN